MSLLDEIIEGATDDAVSTSSLLRKVQVVAHRLGAEEIEAWAKRELRGYGPDDPLPAYRSDIRTPVRGHWVAINYQMHQMLSSDGLPDEATEWLFRTNLRQGLAEIEELAGGGEDRMAGVPWPSNAVVLWNQLARAGKVVAYSGADLLSAMQLLTRGVLLGVIDTARNVGMEFALDLQSANPDAGTVDGPTMADAPIERIVWNVTNNLFGDGAQIAHGEGITQHSSVVKGDLTSLLNAAAGLGLSEEGREELARVVLEDDLRRPSKVKKFLAKVGDGAFAVGTGITAEVAATQLMALIAAYLG